MGYVYVSRSCGCVCTDAPVDGETGGICGAGCGAGNSDYSKWFQWKNACELCGMVSRSITVGMPLQVYSIALLQFIAQLQAPDP